MKTWWKWLVVPMVVGLAVWGVGQVTPTLAAQVAEEEQAPQEARRGGYCARYRQEKREAEALGITVDELRAARREAAQQTLKEALEAGRITQEQYESRLAWLTLRSEYLHPERLWAQVLGMSVDDLRAACDEGKTMWELIQAQGLDRKAVRQALEDAAVDQVMKALQDDVVDMEMLVRTWVRGMGRHRGAQGRPGGPGHGPVAPQPQPMTP